jgi:AcrR family transcriptional regulator
MHVIVGRRGNRSQSPDRRVARTHRALLQAFVDLMQERSYRSVTIADIVGRADVGRSTFYDHFRDKDEILLNSMEWMFAILADAVRPDAPRQPLDQLAAHFWSNRSLARTVLTPPVQPKLLRALTKIIEERLATGKPANQRLRAVGIAAAQLGILEAWTRGELSASPAEVTDALLEIARS